MWYLRTFLAIIIIAVGSTTFVQAQSAIETKKDVRTGTNESELISKLEDAAKSHAADSAVAGVSVAVVHNNDTLLMNGYGMADLEFDVPMPEDAIFEIGSITKQFTAAAILQLAGKDSLDLDDTINKHLPDYSTRGHKVTIRQLLHHTSGIRSYRAMPSIRTLFKHSMGRDTVLSIVEDEPFRFAPGTVMSYSNTGYFLLGYIIENASNQSYESYLEEHILGPAGMENTYYCDEKAVNKNKAHGYERHPKKGFLHKDFEVHIWPYSAGSLCSTVRDLVKWNQELHNGDILADSLYQEMITPGQLADGTKVLYGMGLGVYTDNGLPVIGHGGAISGYISESRYYPDQDLTIVALQNTTSPPPPQALSDSLAQIVIGTEEESKNNTYSGNLNDLTGRYTGPVRGRILDLTIEAKDGKLIMRMTGREAKGDTLQHVSDLTWKWQDKQYITFGKVSDQVVELRSTARGIGLYTGYYILRRVR